MKPFDVIRNDKRVFHRMKGSDGGVCYVSCHGKSLAVIYSNGGGWDHVSVSLMNRCPTWDEMCFVKEIFFDPEECCIEYHPARKDYVNIHPTCLHIWRPQNHEIPMPPKYMV